MSKIRQNIQDIQQIKGHSLENISFSYIILLVPRPIRCMYGELRFALVSGQKATIVLYFVFWLLVMSEKHHVKKAAHPAISHPKAPKKQHEPKPVKDDDDDADDGNINYWYTFVIIL